MAPFPLVLSQYLGHYGSYIVYFVIGLAFGYVLEIAGFGVSTKLAAQFYFKDMTVLKVMFTAIVVAMVLVFSASAIGLLDYNLVWVNPTYLWPGIVGGLIMGFGFIIGGFCPGTSLVSMATFKIDGVFFALGVMFGIFLFGETVEYYEIFWNSSYMGRFTLMQLFNLGTGAVVLLVVLMALFMFWGAEMLERIFGGKDPKSAPKLRYAGALVLVLLGVGLVAFGQPTNADRWARISQEKNAQLANREVQIQPLELLHTMHDTAINLVLIDVRGEGDYNLFHIAEAKRVPLDELDDLASELQLEPANTVFVVMSNGEVAATEAWKTLVAESVPNVYILEGGVNNWLSTFAGEDQRIKAVEGCQDDVLCYQFAAALGSSFPAADPDFHAFEGMAYDSRINLGIKRGPSGGGCG